MAKKPNSTQCPGCGATAKLCYTNPYSAETRFKHYRCEVLECGMTFINSESLYKVIIPSHLNKKEKAMIVHTIQSLESFDNVIHNEPTFVLFTQENCMQSTAALSQFYALAKVDVDHVYLAVDPNMKNLAVLRHRYSVTKMPTMLFFSKGNFSKLTGCDEILQYFNEME